MALPLDDVRADAFILMEGYTGQVLLERNMRAIRKPASITKIMTTLLALERGDLSDIITVSQAAADIPDDAATIYLEDGETLTLEEALYATMLESANEAANAVGEYVAGDLTSFAALMTQRAKELGAENTNFANANGLTDDNHYTSAYDMALITREALTHQAFRDIWGSYQYLMEATNLQPEIRILNNKNRLLPQGPMAYPGISGGKTGYTSASQNTLVEAAERDGRQLICVLLQGPSAVANFEDAVLLLDYGFSAFQPFTFEDPEYEDGGDFLLHQEFDAAEVTADYDLPVENEDGSRKVDVTLSLPPEKSAGLMYRELGTLSLISPPPPPLPAPPPLFSLAGIARFFDDTPPFSWLAGLGSLLTLAFTKLLALINLLPGWLALIVKVILSLFALLFALACVFRTLRWRRRLRRRAMKRRLEARRRDYREQQSFWG
ncbi:MAG: D-alanyl-D-alanine carboxypeptidase [Peptococcaceae bacterium]|nr:D-alanyl-D-alanine carboxypeptidase [Peptococcaceae bacterium]